MKKFTLFVLISSFCLIFLNQGFAASVNYNSQFVTKDGRHMCGAWMKQDTFRPCEEVGIVYNSDGEVIQGKKPFFDKDESGLIVIGTETFCLKRGVETEKLSDCDDKIMEVTSEGSRKCVIKDGVKTCEEPSENTKISSGSVSLNSSFSGSRTLAPSSCKVNGQSVDCAEMAKTAKSWLTAGIWVLLAIGILFLICTVLWIWTLVHALSNHIPNKVLWVAVLIFLGILGSIIYYFVIMRKYTTVLVPNQSNPAYQMNVGITYQEGPVVTNTNNPGTPVENNQNKQ